ncbi:hypothetical protein ABVT39_003875, partial [Epinephelus coioides]
IHIQLLPFAAHAQAGWLVPLLNSAFRGRGLICLSTLASSSAECPAVTPIGLYYGSLQRRTLRVFRPTSGMLCSAGADGRSPDSFVV